jgi:hypothetical protein
MPGSFSSQRKSRICPIGGLWTIGSELDRETREQFACGCGFNRQAKQDAPRAWLVRLQSRGTCLVWVPSGQSPRLPDSAFVRGKYAVDRGVSRTVDVRSAHKWHFIISSIAS